MNGLFKDLSTNLARFVYAWLVPSATAVAAFAALVLPDLRGAGATHRTLEPLEAVGLFAVAVLLLSIIFAYTSLPVYRALEGYTLPHKLRRRLLRRRTREWYRLRALVERNAGSATERGVLLERLAGYPGSADDLMPTRLGNALRGMERYGVDRFGLDSQHLWYELLAVAPDNLRRDTEDARASVDFFLSAIVHMVLLAVVAAGVAVGTDGITSALVAVVSLILIPIAYQRAVLNVGEWRAAVQALINTSRFKLPPVLGLQVADDLAAERRLWRAYTRFVVYGVHDELLDARRVKQPETQSVLSDAQPVEVVVAQAAGGGAGVEGSAEA